MALVTVSIGSNIERDRHVRTCLDALAATFESLAISRVFESEPVGFEDGRNFYNLVAAFESDWSVGELQAWCKRLEFANGEHDGVALPRGEICHHAFVLQPLAELLPETRHPESGATYAALWADFDPGSQRLWAVPFAWAGRKISHPD